MANLVVSSVTASSDSQEKGEFLTYISEEINIA